MLDRQRAEVARAEQLVDAFRDPGDALAVHARDVRDGRLDILQVDEEEPLAEVADRLHRVVALRRPPAGVDGGTKNVVRIADQREHLVGSLLGMVLVGEADSVLAQHRLRAGAVVAEHLAHASEQVDAERIRQGASRREICDRVAEVACQADDPKPVTVEEVARNRHVLGRRPPPVQVRHPEIHGVEPGCLDCGEQFFEVGAEGLDRLEGGVRRHVERAPLVRGPVSQLLADVVRTHERQGQRR